MVAPRFLLDTNILSEPTKLQPNTQVTSQLARYSDVISTASIVYHEVKFGCLVMPESRRKQAVEAYIQKSLETHLLLVPYCQKSALWHAEERARLRQVGETPSYADAQIAAIAVVNQLILVTRNVKDFENFQGLKIENWFG